jgi:hypothetical protein
MLQLVEHYYDYFRMALPIPTYMNFISSYGNNIFSQEQLRKQKTTCVTSRSYQLSQVSFLPFALILILVSTWRVYVLWHLVYYHPVTNGPVADHCTLVLIHMCFLTSWSCTGQLQIWRWGMFIIQRTWFWVLLLTQWVRYLDVQDLGDSFVCRTKFKVITVWGDPITFHSKVWQGTHEDSNSLSPNDIWTFGVVGLCNLGLRSLCLHAGDQKDSFCTAF